MRLAATVLAVVRLHQVVSAVPKVALQLGSMARQAAMVLHHLNSMEHHKEAKADTVALRHRNHSMEASNSSMEVNSSSTEVVDMVRLPHSLLATRHFRMEGKSTSCGRLISRERL
jgi:hypothetical protein